MKHAWARPTTWLVAAAWITSFAPARGAAGTPVVTATWVRSEIESKGARQFLLDVVDGEAWTPLLERIAVGEREWLEIAGELRGASDAHASEMLNCAISEAVVHSPGGVLQLVKRGAIRPEEACGWYGFLTYDEEASTKALVGFIEAREKAVSKVQASALLVQRDDCLRALRQARSDLSSTENP